MKLSAGLKAEFREQARRIIDSDRRARKAGRSQNTIGEIARALEQAYRAGLSRSGASSSAVVEEVDWVTLPPRARQALEYLGGSPFAETTRAALAGITLERVESGPGLGRWEVKFGSHVGGRTLSHGAMASLIRLGVIGPCLTKTGQLSLTPLGLRIMENYLKRAREGDASLPLSSVGSR